MPYTLYNLIEKSARNALGFQRDDGTMPSGHNGPYRDPETPVRNTAHWLVTFLKVYELTGDRRFLTASERAVHYLKSPAARPMQAAYWCRKNPEKDFSNGLVGQAWVIEALMAASRFLPDEDLSASAAEVFLLHPYDKERAAWRVLNVDGTHGPPDLTLNHQLWFAASGSMIPGPKDGEVACRVKGFLDRLEVHLAIHPDGLIRHRSASFLASPRRNPVLRSLMSIREARVQSRLKPRSVGYHAFNLYALALLSIAHPAHSCWSGRKMAQILKYAGSRAYRAALPENPFGFGYNPSGIELAYALQVFNQGTGETAAYWVSEQFQRCYNFESGMMDRNSDDSVTLAARLYEATRLPDLELERLRA